MENPEQPQYQPQPQYTPLPQPQYTQPQQPQPPTAQTDPGKTLGIVGFIFAFVFLHAIGLPVSIMGYVKSKKAGFKNPLAVAGIILNSIFLVCGIAFLGLVAITALSYSGINNRANNSTSQASAASVVKWSEIYSAENGTYPTKYSELNSSSNVVHTAYPILSEPNTPNTVEFYSCGDVGNKVGYYNYEDRDVAYMYSGNADSSTQCTLSKD